MTVQSDLRVNQCNSTRVVVNWGDFLFGANHKQVHFLRYTEDKLLQGIEIFKFSASSNLKPGVSKINLRIGSGGGLTYIVGIGD